MNSSDLNPIPTLEKQSFTSIVSDNGSSSEKNYLLVRVSKLESQVQELEQRLKQLDIKNQDSSISYGGTI